MELRLIDKFLNLIRKKQIRYEKIEQHEYHGNFLGSPHVITVYKRIVE